MAKLKLNLWGRLYELRSKLVISITQTFIGAVIHLFIHSFIHYSFIYLLSFYKYIALYIYICHI